MRAVSTVGDLREEHLEQEVKVAAEGHGYGAMSGSLGMFVQMPEDNLTVIALWRGEKCVQITIPSDTKANLR